METERKAYLLKGATQINMIYDLDPKKVKADAFDGARAVANESKGHEHFSLNGVVLTSVVVGLREIGLNDQDTLRVVSKLLDKDVIS